jgi:hypothetical protein
MRHDGKTRGRVALWATMTGAAALALGLAAPAFASTAAPAHAQVAHARGPWIDLVPVTPSQGDTAGSGGVFNVALGALALNATGNKELSAAEGYKPGIANPAKGVGHADPFAPGFVLLLSTTPKKLGGPDANVMGAFQLTDVVTAHNLKQVIADWEVGKPDVFGKPGTKVTLTAFVLSGTAPGILKGTVHPISNVVRETFWIGK